MTELPEKPGVYKIIEDDEIVYIGQSQNIRKRVRSHTISRKENVSVNYDIIDDERLRRSREKELIREYQPELNQHLKNGETVQKRVQPDLVRKINEYEGKNFSEKMIKWKRAQQPLTKEELKEAVKSGLSST